MQWRWLQSSKITWTMSFKHHSRCKDVSQVAASQWVACYGLPYVIRQKADHYIFIQVWNVLHTACWKYRMQKSCQKSPYRHHRTTLSGYIFATKARINNRKKLVKQQYVLQMSPTTWWTLANSGWDHFVSLGHPTKFLLVSRLGSITAWHVVVGGSQTLQHWIEGATYVQQGDHHVGHWPTFLVAAVKRSLQ